jgi:hypothetical protein
MRRSLIIVLAVVLASTAIVGLTSALTKRICAQSLVRPGDDLAWLRLEFRLSDSEMERIRQLHEGYLPKCRELCDRIAARKKELQIALDGAKSLTPAAEQKLAEIGSLRAQCQAQMLRHFFEVSQAMPPNQGRRYLAEMERLTLGFHEQFENSMSANQPSPHVHH